MRFGYSTMNAADGLLPAKLARQLEERGFESMWVPEHTHIPTSRQTPHPSTNPLPDGYLHMMDPLVSLAAAASATERLLLGTAVCLVLQHDVIALAKAVATLDVISGGRLILGVGTGWNEEELADHRPDVPFKSRYSAMAERVAALRALWAESENGFAGRWDRVSPSWVFPKPVHGTVPIALGNWGALGMDHAARYADEWMPIDALMPGDGRPDIGAGVERFRQMVAEHGRDPDSVPISLFMFSRPTDARIERYAELGVQRVVVSVPSAGLSTAEQILRDLDDITPVVERYSND